MHTLGKRLHHLIRSTGVSQKIFADKHNLPQSSLSLWCSDKRTPSYRKLKNIVKALSIEGIPCSVEWLINGDTAGDMNDTSTKVSNKQDDMILKEITLLKNLYPTFAIMIVHDDSMSPIFNQGDYVGGFKLFGEDIKKLSDHYCIIETIDGYKGLNFIQYDQAKNLFHLKTHASKQMITSYSHEHIDLCARVVWRRIK